MIFDELKFYLKNITIGEDTAVGELELKFLCEDCRKEMDKPYYTYQILQDFDKKHRLGYHFVCESCYNIRKEHGDTMTPITEQETILPTCVSCSSYAKCVNTIKTRPDIMIRCIGFGALRDYINNKENNNA